MYVIRVLYVHIRIFIPNITLSINNLHYFFSIQYFELPKVPVLKPAPKGNYGEVTLRPILSIFNYSLIPGAKTTKSETPKTFEELNQRHGYVLYETTLPEGMPDPAILSADGIKDRANVFIDKVPGAVPEVARCSVTKVEAKNVVISRPRARFSLNQK